MKKIFFIVSNLHIGSAVMSGFQIKDGLSVLGVSCEVIVPSEINLSTEGAIFIWVKEAIPHIIKCLVKNIHLYVPVDSLSFNRGHIELINKNLFDGVLVNNSYMKQKLLGVVGEENLHVIPQHWDPRYEDRSPEPLQDLRFGYLGAISCLRISDNLVNHTKLAREKDVYFVDTEVGIDMTELVKKGQYPQGTFKIDGILKAPIPFNCHMSLRYPGGGGFKYKPATKLATAAALNHNILTTNDYSVQDILPNDYPFIVKSCSYEEISAMMDNMRRDYYGDKSLWNLGLSIIKDVRNKLSLGEVSKVYKNILKLYF